MITWAIWIAVAALLPATGKFLDDYHIRAETKSKVRDRLVSAFVWLADVSIPDVGRKLAHGLGASARRIGWKGACIAFCALTISCAVWLDYERVKRSRDLVERVLNLFEVIVAIPFLVVMFAPAIVAVIVSLAVTLRLARVLENIRSDVIALLASLLGPVIVSAVVISCFAIVSWADWFGT